MFCVLLQTHNSISQQSRSTHCVERRQRQAARQVEGNFILEHSRFLLFLGGRRRRRNKTRIIKIKWKESFPGKGSRASGIFTVCNHDYWLLTVKLFNLINTLIEWQANNEIKQTSPEFRLKLPRKSKSGGDLVAELAREALNLIESFTGNRFEQEIREIRTCHDSWCALRNGCRWCSYVFRNLERRRRWSAVRRRFRLVDGDLCVFAGDDRRLNLAWLSAGALLRQRNFLIAWRHFECLLYPVYDWISLKNRFSR